MGIEPPFMYEAPARYTLVNSFDKSFEPKSVTQSSRSPKLARPTQDGPYISAEDLNRHSDSYMIIPYGNINHKTISKNIKPIIKWSRIILLVLRLCSWFGAAGLLVCVIMIRPIGSTMDWIMRVPPALALCHLTYAVYHLSRSAKARTPTSSGSYMIFGAIIDSCLIPFQVLLAILARNQLIGALQDGTQKWVTILDTDFQEHTIIYSTYLLGITTASLHLAGLCLSLFLAMKFRQISALPPDMNPLEDNLTARRHRKAKTSTSTFMSTSTNPDSIASLVDAAGRSIPWAHTRTDSSSSFTNQQSYRLQSTPGTPQTSPKRKTMASHATLDKDYDVWGTRPPTSLDNPPQEPPEFQHLKSHNFEEDKLTPAPLSMKSKYDFTNRSPRPLGLHPPTPRETTPATTKGFDVRVLRNIDGNSSAKRASASLWDDIKLELDSMESTSSPGGSKKHYGDVIGMGRVTRSQTRVVSSGFDNSAKGLNIKRREVSGKVAEEGRAGFHEAF